MASIDYAALAAKHITRPAETKRMPNFLIYARNKKGKTRDGLAQSIFITLYLYYKILPVRENFKTG